MRRVTGFAFFIAALCATVPAWAEQVAQENAVATYESSEAQDEARIEAAAAVVQRSLDAYRAGDINLWLDQYSSDVLVVINSASLSGKDALRQVFGQAFKIDLPDPVVLESGWTGERIYLVQREFFPDGTTFDSYAEYEVRDGKIAAVYANN